MPYQKVTDRSPDRKDHIWRKLKGAGFKCVLCGAVCLRLPPHYPTPVGWLPDHYEKVTDEDRAACPYKP